MTTSPPRVSIGMPVYNGERYIEETLNSLLAQTFTGFELVICDNASTDRTQQICEAYAARDTRVRYYRNAENLGGSKNYTRVFELSAAPYFKWAAHDDLCGLTFLERCVAVLDAHPNVALCYPQSAFIDQHSTVVAPHDDACNLRSQRPSERVHQFLAEASTYCFPAYGLIRREALRKTRLMGPFVCSDQVLLVELALRGEFYEVPERLFLFREHPDRSIRQLKSFWEYVKWHDPKRGCRVQLPRWKLVYEFLRAIAGAKIERREARRCYISVLKWCRWHSSSLLNDLQIAAGQIATLIFRMQPMADKNALPPVTRAADSC